MQSHLRLVILSAILLCALALLGSSLVSASPTDTDGCRFVLGFKTIHDLIPNEVGQCIDNEGYNPANGDALQHTTAWHGKGGLLVWRKADNWTAFTDGANTWINGPYGIQKRPNAERFDWENDGQQVASQPMASTPPPVSVPQFGNGMFVVGSDIQPGTYRTRKGADGCYYARLSGFGGTLSEIIANENTDDPAVVTIAPTDKGFQSVRCGTWTQDLSQITASKTSFNDGTYIVGTDIQPGTYRSSGREGCYYARLSGFGGSTREIIANENTDSPAIVSIALGDKGFQSVRCGTWRLQ